MSLVRNQLLPRIPILFFLISIVLSRCVAVFRLLKSGKRSFGRNPSSVCIESGIKGWQLIEFKEIYASACEYLGENRVKKIVIESRDNYFPTLRRSLVQDKPTHFIYDPRTGNQSWLRGLFDAFRVALLLEIHGIVPIVILTDLAIRKWRAFGAVVSASRGIVVNYLSPKEVHPIFPHSRLIGPCLMPFSTRLLRELDALRSKRTPSGNSRAIFAGSLYEPRTTLLMAIKALLQKRGLDLEIKGRVLGSERYSDTEYWMSLINTEILVTTADQIKHPDSDWTWVKHLLYRYLETTACGALLIAPVVPGVERYFVPGRHFIPFETAEEAAELVEYYLKNESQRIKIANEGHFRARQLIETNAYWTGIDVALGRHSLS